MGAMTVVDKQVGKLVEATQASGKPWAILLTSDSGRHLGEMCMVGERSLLP